MTGVVTVYATFADAAEAARIARIVVEERLAACANILGPIRSVYRWEAAIEEAEETAVLLKTRADAADTLIERLASLHSYDVPAAVAWPITAVLPTYAAWVEAETRRP